MRWLGEPLSYFRTPSTLPVETSQWFEEREAARFSLYRWHEYLELSAQERAGVIAYYRTYNKLHALIDDYMAKQAEVRAKQATAGKGRGRR